MHSSDLDHDSPADPPQARPLPADLPTSLNDRRPVSTFMPDETEIYDAWQGECLSLPLPSLPRR